MEHIVTILLFACHNVRTYGVKKQFCRASISIFSYSLVSCERDEMFFWVYPRSSEPKEIPCPKIQTCLTRVFIITLAKLSCLPDKPPNLHLEYLFLLMPHQITPLKLYLYTYINITFFVNK